MVQVLVELQVEVLSADGHKLRTKVGQKEQILQGHANCTIHKPLLKP